MDYYVEEYPAEDEKITLHTWRDVEGVKKENFYITGAPGASIPAWFRDVLCKNHLADIADFPFS